MAKKNNTPAKPKLPPEEALYQALSLCRKAGALTMGFDAVEDRPQNSRGAARSWRWHRLPPSPAMPCS